MLTDQDIQKLIKANKQVFATKEDLKSFATKEDFNEIKEDLKSFATKEDFNEIKEDLKSFATKEELDKKSTLLLKEIFSVKDELSQRINSLDEKFDRLMTSIDSYAKKSDSYFQEMLLLSNKVNRQEKWIQEIAKKVGVRLEY